MALPLISEILEEVSKESSRKKKLEILKSHSQNKPFVTLLKLAFDPNLEFDLPETDPPYSPSELRESNDSGLYTEIRKMPYFVKGRNQLPRVKREMMFIELLETVHPKEAELILNVKNKTLPYKGVTFKLVKEAFPSLV